MISPLPTPTPPTWWIAHYIPTRTPEAVHAAVAITQQHGNGIDAVVGVVLVILAVILMVDIIEDYVHHHKKIE